MWEQLLFYVQLGLNHVLDVNGYDHVLFLVVLVVPFLFAQYKKVITLVTVFTVGHTLALILSAYKIVQVNSGLVEFLIPVTIAFTALYSIVFVSKSLKNNNITVFITLFFGLIHGLGFSSYFKMIIGRSSNKLVPLFEFSLGIELAQIVIVIAMLLLSTLFRSFFGVSKKIWVISISVLIIGLVIPMLLSR